MLFWSTSTVYIHSDGTQDRCPQCLLSDEMAEMEGNIYPLYGCVLPIWRQRRKQMRMSLMGSRPIYYKTTNTTQAPGWIDGEGRWKQGASYSSFVIFFYTRTNWEFSKWYFILLVLSKNRNRVADTWKWFAPPVHSAIVSPVQRHFQLCFVLSSFFWNEKMRVLHFAFFRLIFWMIALLHCQSWFVLCTLCSCSLNWRGVLKAQGLLDWSEQTRASLDGCMPRRAMLLSDWNWFLLRWIEPFK